MGFAEINGSPSDTTLTPRDLMNNEDLKKDYKNFYNNLFLGAMGPFFMAVNIGPCAIGWIYTSEIATKKSVSVAMTVNWVELLLIGVITKPLFSLTKYGFIVFGTLNTVMTLIMFVNMKETKGLSEEQVGRLFMKEDTQVVPLNVAPPSEDKPAEEVEMVKRDVE
jgi:hypothetical protein